MPIKIRPWGNNAAICLPSAALEKMELDIGDALSFTVAGQSMTLIPVRTKPHYRLEELMAHCNVSALEPEDLANWNAVQPIGYEV